MFQVQFSGSNECSQFRILRNLRLTSKVDWKNIQIQTEDNNLGTLVVVVRSFRYMNAPRCSPNDST